jgi:hypothetical protein
VIVELTPEQRRLQEVALPLIFGGGFHPERIDWYTRLTVESGLVKGGATRIPEFIAAMISESSLNNRALGDSNPDIHFGVGWMQFDTQYHARSLDTIMAVRSDPLWSLQYATDPVNGLCRHGTFATDFKKNLWNAWRDETINPSTGWSPLGAAFDAWERVT